jgi:secreted PhoX family phosphatase
MTPTRLTGEHDDGDIVANDSGNPSLEAIVGQRYSRRQTLIGGFAATAAALAPGAVLAQPRPSGGLGFTAVAKHRLDVVTVPQGYRADILYSLGDPLAADVPAYRGDGTDEDFSRRAGDHHDGMRYFGLTADGKARDDTSSRRGLLVMNHENITATHLHPKGPTTVEGARPAAEALKEMQCHGVSAVEIMRTSGGWTYVQGSAFNRRVTPLTAVDLHGPVRGSALVRTAYAPDGTRARGTLNNCANGYTAWGSYLTCEENWAGYFRRDEGDEARRSDKERTGLRRYNIADGARGANGWSTVAGEDAGMVFSRWNATARAEDARGDFRHEPNTFGWIVEIDPYDPKSTPRKRTALGRFAHEGCFPSRFIAGQRPAWYMGDDTRGEYFYKFISATPWAAADAQGKGRLDLGDKYLDRGVLHVARFNADGTGAWLPLVFGQGPLTADNATYAFADQADVLVHTRLAADALGATRMDRPEWAAINPKNGEAYVSLTNTNSTVRPIEATDAANPRFYTDPAGTTSQRGNPNGHILRVREDGDRSDAVTFTWDIYAFGAGSDLDAANINLSGLDDSNDFSSPDGLAFSRASVGLADPLLWIQTDDNAYTDVTNPMMLAAIPGRVGDGALRTIRNADGDKTREQTTYVGAQPGLNLRRFLVGPRGCEVTGIDTTPDGRTLFVNIQHPGGSWPANQKAPGATGRPRSSTLVITRDDGGIVGV